ncbi:MAG TPA: FHA domain-containing protein [Polyangiaceae bacterium]|nr:FHA domain-containing protein [Polyangiaceae bacterium]
MALRFISGKYQGGEFPLNDSTPVIVGRSSDLDMVLVEEMVSRRHARIELRGGSVVVEDLGSTNGTFVNGERIERATLSEGDRLLIGTSILKLVAVEDPPGSRRNLQKVAFGKETIRQQTASASGSARMTGNLDEIPLPDLMQLFGTSKKTGTLVLTAQRVGRLHLGEGLVINAAIEGLPQLSPLKAAYRMLAWTEGTFALEPSDGNVEPSLGLTAQAYLMEGFRQQDELNNLTSRAPDLQARLSLKTPLEAPLSTLEQSQLEVLQSCINSPDFQTALDRSPKTDLETVSDVLDLLKRGYLQIG